MRRALGLALALGACLIGTLAAPAEARRVALVIGNSNYKVGALPNPAHDAAAVAEVLERQLKFDKVIVRLNLGAAEFRSALRELSTEAQGAELGVVYYAGHGIEVGGRNILVPVDAKLARAGDVDLETIALDTVLSQLDGVQRLKLVILDACRNNPFQLYGGKRSVGRGLTRIEPEGNTLVAYAAKEGTTAEDGTGLHSPFTAALLKRIATPGLDVRRLFGYVSEDVMAATGRAQEPWLYGRMGGDELFLVSQTEAATLPAVAPPLPSVAQPSEAATAWAALKDSTSVAELSIIAARYRGSVYADLAQARIGELKAAEEKRKLALAVLPKDAAKEIAAAKAPDLPPAKAPDLVPPAAPAPMPGPPAPLPGALTGITECDRLAASPWDAPTGVAGVELAALDAARAIPACQAAVAAHAGEPRLQAWLGRALQKAGRSDEAASWYEKAAAKEQPTAMASVGFLYIEGRVVRRDYAKARAWLEKAAERGEPSAMNNLGSMYRDGLGGPRDYAKARAWLEKAAAKDVANSMVSLGIMHRSGVGAPLDYRKARAWFERAAAKGEPAAMTNLGAMLHDAQGGPRDYARARAWFEKAAARGEPAAMLDLALYYDHGLGVAQDPRTSAQHLLAAARAGSPVARAALDGDMARWAADTVRAVQALLAASGDYTGPVNGRWGEASRAAAKSYAGRRS